MSIINEMTQYKKIPSLCFLVLAMKSVHIDDDDGHHPVSQVMGTAVAGRNEVPKVEPPLPSL